jgi:twitching motility protein PilU
MEQSLTPGSCTFEQALAKLYLGGTITYEDALSSADSPTNLAWLINQSQHSQPNSGAREKSNLNASFDDFDLSKSAEFAR